MTREEAKQIFDSFGKTFTLDEARKDAHALIDKIYDDFGKQQKKKRYKIPMRKEKLN